MSRRWCGGCGIKLDRKAGEPFPGGGATQGQRLDPPDQLPVQLDLECPDLRDVQAPILQGKAELGIREAVVAALPFKAGIAGFLPRFHAAEEGLKRLVETSQDLLQHLRINLGKLRRCRLQTRQFSLLGVLRDGHALPTVGRFPLFQASVIQQPAQLQGLVESTTLRLSGIQPEAERLAPRHPRVRCSAIYRWMVWLLTFPAVETKYERVHSEG